MMGRNQPQTGDQVTAHVPDRAHGANENDCADVRRVDVASLPVLPAAPPSNVVPFVRTRRAGQQSGAPLLTITSEGRPAPRHADRRRLVQAVFVLGSLAVHGGLLGALWETPRPLASIGVEVVSVDIVLGGRTEAGLAMTPGESQVESPAPIEEPKPEEQVADRRQATTDLPQDIPVARRETAPEERPPEQPIVRAEPVRRQSPETETPVAMVQTPQAEIPTALPRETAPEITASIVPAEPKEAKPAAAKPQPKPARKTERAPERKDIAARTAEERSRAERAASSAPSTAASGVGRGRSENDANYRGIVLAHLARYKQYPADARRNGDQGAPRVEFTLDGAGRVTSVRLAGGSGHGILDQDAQAAVRRASPFPPPPDARPRRFNVPVTYSLQ
jgi:protein TonB